LVIIIHSRKKGSINSINYTILNGACQEFDYFFLGSGLVPSTVVPSTFL
jgi:hypothetical protein